MTYTKYQIQNTGHRGFTLIEALVAVAILALAVAGPLVTAGRALVAVQLSNDQLTASYLAQEGIEFIRIVRDNLYLETYPNTSNAWTNFTSSISPCYKPLTCKFDFWSSTPLMPFTGSAPPFYLAGCTIGAGGRTCTPPNFYTLSSNPVLTPFARTIQFEMTSANDVRVISTVSWTFHGTPYSISVTGNLTPWQ